MPNNDAFYDRLNAIERVKLALAKHVAGEPFCVEPEDIAKLIEEYHRLRELEPR